MSVLEMYCHVKGVTIDGVWIGDSIYWPLTHSRLVSTSNYSTTANLHISQITTAPAKPFPICCVFISGSQVTASNNGDSSASRSQVLSSQTPVENWTWCPSCLGCNISARTNRNPRFQQYLDGCMRICLPNRCLETAVKRTSENTTLLLLRMLPSNGCCLQSHRLATGIYATLRSLVSLRTAALSLQTF
jgi:hypothetical protein